MSEHAQPVVIYHMYQGERWFRYGPRKRFYQLYPQTSGGKIKGPETKIRKLTSKESWDWALWRIPPPGTYIPNKAELNRLTEQRLKHLVKRHKST